VTTAIVKAGVLLLHRTVGLGADQRAGLRAAAAQLAGKTAPAPPAGRERSTEEWARQEPVRFENRNDAAAAVETELIKQEIEQEIAEEIAAECLTDTAGEVAQAVSVAAAYFEDTLQTPPPAIHTAGTLGAAALTALLKEAHIGPLAVREMLHSEMLGAGAASAGTPGGVPLGWLAGVRGALAN